MVVTSLMPGTTVSSQLLCTCTLQSMPTSQISGLVFFPSLHAPLSEYKKKKNQELAHSIEKCFGWEKIEASSVACTDLATASFQHWRFL